MLPTHLRSPLLKSFFSPFLLYLYWQKNFLQDFLKILHLKKKNKKNPTLPIHFKNLGYVTANKYFLRVALGEVFNSFFFFVILKRSISLLEYSLYISYIKPLLHELEKGRNLQQVRKFCTEKQLVVQHYFYFDSV